MKHLITITFAALIFCCANIYGQIGELKPLDPIKESIYFTYDEAGNRIKRSITLSATPISTNDDDDELTTSSSEIPNEEEAPDFGSQKREIHVYPNPVSVELTVDIWNGDEKENYRLNLFDMSGKLVFEQKIEGNSRQHVDFNSYPLGTYLLIINASEKKFEYKIVKSN